MKHQTRPLDEHRAGHNSPSAFGLATPELSQTTSPNGVDRENCGKIVSPILIQVTSNTERGGVNIK